MEDLIGWKTKDLIPVVYDELRELARLQLRKERSEHTLQPTALVHEVYLRIAKQRIGTWNDRAHFFAAAALMVRRVLINHERARRAAKRGGGIERVDLEDTLAVHDQSVDLLALDELLDRLAVLDERQALIVELRFFGGLTIPEVAQALDVSDRTVDGEWRLARAWLHSQFQGNA